MPTKRNIKNEVEDLKPNEGDSGKPLVLNLTGLEQQPGGERPTRSDSPHPEWTIQQWPERRPDELNIAVPKIIPEPWRSLPMLFVHTCDNAEKYCMDHMDEDSSVVTACQLWDGLTEDQLWEDTAIREDRGEQIPPALEQYSE